MGARAKEKLKAVPRGEPLREGRWAEEKGGSATNPGDTVHLGNETHFRFGAKNSSINIVTNPIKGLATLGILASSLPSPDCNHFGAHIKLSNKKALLLTPFNVLYFSRLPSHSYVLLRPFLKWITVFLPLFPPSVFADPMQGHSWSQQSLGNNAAFLQVLRNGIPLENAAQPGIRYSWINKTKDFYL